jgi:hypothetical protein
VVMRDLLQPTTQSRGGHAVPHTKFLTGPLDHRAELPSPVSRSGFAGVVSDDAGEGVAGIVGEK